jgi:hypothetical protein
MIIFKPAAALLALGLSGWLGMATQAPFLPVAAPSASVAQPASASSDLPDYDTVRRAVEQAMRERVAHDLDDAGTGVVVPSVAIERTSLRTLEARGEGTVAMPGARAIPVDIVATWDVIDRRIASVDYTARAVDADLTAVDQAVRAAIAQRIGARIAGEFQGQTARFELIEVQGVDYGRHRTRLQGAGVTDFGTEGVAYTPFVATLDKHTGELVDLQYELLQEDVASPIVALDKPAGD